MTINPTEVAARFRRLLLKLRLLAAATSQTEVRDFERNLGRIVSELSGGSDGVLEPGQVPAILRTVNRILGNIEVELLKRTNTASGTILARAVTTFQELHRELFALNEIPSNAVVLRIGSIMPLVRAKVQLYRTAAEPLSTTASRIVSPATSAIERYVLNATGKLPSANVIRSITRILQGELPIDLLGMAPAEFTPAKGMLARGERLIVSESMNTMREGHASAMRAGGIVLVAKWTLSPRHVKVDICDQIATTDIRYGPGWYTPERWPAAPHPYCACYQGEIRQIPVRLWR